MSGANLFQQTTVSSCHISAWIGHFSLLYGLLFAFCTAAPSAWASKPSTQKIALIIGHNRGDSTLPILRFAQRDAQRLASILVELGGYQRRHIELLLGPSPQTVRAAMLRIHKKVLAHKGPSIFFFYYSGHAQEEHFQLGARPLPFAEMLQFSRSLPVRIRLLIVDSCYSGRMLRLKGARRKPTIQWIPTQSLRTRGMAILTSSEASGRSYESERIKGSLFTSSLLAGLRGAADKDRDQRISLSELRDYVYQKTLARSAEQSNEVQRPSHRLDLQGQGAFFLTFLKRASAQLVFPKKMAGHFFLFRNAELLQDFRKEGGEELRVALESGRYRLQVRRHGWLGRIKLALNPAAQHQVQVNDFRWEQLSVGQQFKGGPYTSAPIGLGASFHYNPISNLSSHGMGVLLGLDSGRWLRVGAGYRYSGANPLGVPYQTHTISLRLAAGYGLGFGPFGFWLGAHIDPELLVRTSTTDTLMNAGFTTGLLGHFDYYVTPSLALRLSLSGGLELLLFDQNQVRTTAIFDMGIGFVWRP